MKTPRHSTIVVLCAASFLALVLPVGLSSQAEAPLLATPGRTPVLVELFTSEGCSSCPPADALLARLRATQPVPGAEIIVLKEHVDYWDRLGWKDPFSSAQFTARQNGYARSFGRGGLYTPQMVVDGRTEFVGSAEGRARQAVLEAARAPKMALSLEWAQNSPGRAEPPLRVRIEAQGDRLPGDSAEVFLAVTEDNLQSDVHGGENVGRRFVHTGVVRELKRIGRLTPHHAVFSAQPTITMAPEWKPKDLRAVVFVQESRSRLVLAAASIAFPIL